MSSPSAASGVEGCESHPPEHLLRGLDLTPSDLVNVENGRSGFAWWVRFGTHCAVVRFSSSSDQQAGRLAAMTAAEAGGLPVPRVLGQVADECGALLVLEWLPGASLVSFLQANPDTVTACGHRFGSLQAELHQVTAPSEVWSVSRAPALSETSVIGDAVLHLDWHPFNVLVDESGAVTGVIDWDNARRGEPALDAARTWAMLTADPALPEQPGWLRRLLPEFTRAWAEGYGSVDELIEDRHRRWAARMMLVEWQERSLATPDALEPLRRIAET